MHWFLWVLAIYGAGFLCFVLYFGFTWKDWKATIGEGDAWPIALFFSIIWPITLLLCLFEAIIDMKKSRKEKREKKKLEADVVLAELAEREQRFQTLGFPPTDWNSAEGQSPTEGKYAPGLFNNYEG